MTTLLRCTGITRTFPGVRALSSVDFEVQEGEVHALIGENGAGKSTLMHILAGVYPPDSGIIEFQGRPVEIPDERHAQQMGIGIVYQERSLFDLLTVAENIFAGNQPAGRLGTIDRAKMHIAARDLLRRVELHVDPATPLGRLSAAQQQVVEIAKALSFDSRLFILDEPTAALTIAETNTLFRVVRQLKERGVGIVYISHRLEEVFQLADRVTVLKDGRLQGTLAVAETTPEQLVSLMVGRDLVREPGHPPPLVKDVPALEVIGLSGPKTGPSPSPPGPVRFSHLPVWPAPEEPNLHGPFSERKPSRPARCAYRASPRESARRAMPSRPASATFPKIARNWASFWK